MQYLASNGSVHVQRTGNVDTPVGLTVQDSWDVYSKEILLTGEQAKAIAEQLIDIWGDDLDNETATSHS